MGSWVSDISIGCYSDDWVVSKVLACILIGCSETCGVTVYNSCDADADTFSGASAAAMGAVGLGKSLSAYLLTLWDVGAALTD